jgi:Holliday junction resolvase RusA-like endonuclease
MNHRLAFVVPGQPIAKGRARSRAVTTKTGKQFVQHYTPKETVAYEQRVALFCQSAVSAARWLWAPQDRFGLSVRIYRTHEGTGGDLDNLVKAVLDAINGIAFADDRYVRRLAAELSQDAVNPRVEVEITRFRVGEGRAA